MFTSGDTGLFCVVLSCGFDFVIVGLHSRHWSGLEFLHPIKVLRTLLRTLKVAGFRTFLCTWLRFPPPHMSVEPVRLENSHGPSSLLLAREWRVLQLQSAGWLI